MPIKPIRRNNVSNEIFDQMKKMIMSGEWKPGTKIPSENELKKVFSVSRVSIREALQKLQVFGIIETRHGDGTYVKEFSSDLFMNSLLPMLVLDKADMAKVLEFRKILEVESARLAAERALDDEINRLEEIFQNMKRDKDDPHKHALDDLDFHFEIAKMTKNPLIVKVNTILKDILTSYMQTIVAALGYSRGLHFHERLLEAIRSRDSKLAKKCMEEHIDNTLTSMMRVMEERTPPK